MSGARGFALLVLCGVDYVADAITFCIYHFEGGNVVAQVNGLIIGPPEFCA